MPLFIIECSSVLVVCEGGMESGDQGTAAEDKKRWSVLSTTTGGGVDSETETRAEV